MHSEEHNSPSSHHSDQNEQHEKNDEKSFLDNEQLVATIAYAAVGCLIPLLLKPNNQKLQFHGKQGLVLFIGWLIVLIILSVSLLVGVPLFFCYFALNVIALYRAYAGDNWRIPVIGDFADKVNLYTVKSTNKDSGKNDGPKSEAVHHTEPEAKHQAPHHNDSQHQ